MKKLTIFVISLTILLMSASPISVFAKDNNSGNKVTVIIELEDKPVLDSMETSGKKLLKAVPKGKLRNEIKEKQIKIKENIKKSISSDFETLYSYTDVFNGFSVEINAEDVEKIRSLPNVKSVTVSQNHHYIFHESSDQSPQPSYSYESCCDSIGTEYMHEQGIKGQGQVIAIIDSMLDLDHEMFSAIPQNPKYSENDIKNIIASNELNASADNLYYNSKFPFAYNYTTGNNVLLTDSSGGIYSHGTHVTGIAAGNNGVLPDGNRFGGVAPEAQVFFMAVPDLSDNAILAAIDDLSKFDIDCVNCSWGIAYTNRSVVIEALEKLEKSGVSICVSAGNSSRGYYDITPTVDMTDYDSSGMPASEDSFMSIASSDSEKIRIFGFCAYIGDQKILFIDGDENCKFSKAFPTDTDFVYIAKDEEYGDLTGKIAVIERSNLTSGVVFGKAKDAGAIGCIFVYDENDLNVDVSHIPNFPTAVVTKNTGEIIKNLACRKIRSTTESYSEPSDSEYSGLSSYSSWGTNNSLELKPDITAPGKYIYSSIPGNNYKSLNGTSMAAPHSTGAFTLMYQYLKNIGYTDKVDIKQTAEKLIMSTATVKMPDESTPFSPRLQGAGQINLEAALKTPVFLSVNGGKPKVSLKDKLLSQSDSFDISFNITNISDNDASYDLDAVCIIDGYEDFGGQKYVSDSKILSSAIKKINGKDITDDSDKVITVNAQDTLAVTVTIEPDKEEINQQSSIFTNGFFVDGFIRLSALQEDTPDAGLPFTGFYGDWDAFPTLDKPYYDDDSLLGMTRLGSSDDIHKYIVNPDDDSIIDACNILGSNIFDDSYESEDYAGISPNGDGIYDYLCVSVTSLRNSNPALVRIYDANQNMIGENETPPLEKYYPCATIFGNDELSKLDEGNYTVEVTASLCYPDSKDETIKMNFYIDNTDPTLESINISQKDQKSLLTLCGNDNKYVMGYLLTDMRTNSLLQLACADPDNYETTFDITGIDPDIIQISVIDYAGNMADFNANGDKLTGIETVPFEVVSGENSTTVGCRFINYGDTDTQGIVMIAVYGENNELIYVSEAQNILIEGNGESEDITFDLPFNSFYRAKIFAWDNLDSLYPLSAYKEISGR